MRALRFACHFTENPFGTLCAIMKSISRCRLLVEHRRCFQRIIFETVSSVVSDMSDRKKRPGSKLSTVEVERFLRRHPTRVSCVFIRGVGSPWNENGVPGGVRCELVFPAHFSRERPPENRLSLRGPTAVSRTILHVRYFGKSPVSIKPRREKCAAGGPRRWSSWSSCENEGG